MFFSVINVHVFGGNGHDKIKGKENWAVHIFVDHGKIRAKENRA